MNRNLDREKIAHLHIKEGLSFNQLAERFSITKNTVAGIVFRHKQKQKEIKVRYSTYRKENSNEIHIVDHLQGSVSRSTNNHPVAIVKDIDLADKIIAMLEEDTKQYSVMV
jgi:predicted DNA-binding protein YlxM (UPF0122 family)